jgi:hypothetical protein
MLSGLLLSAVLAVPGANPAPQAAQAPQHLPPAVGSTLPTVPGTTTQAPGFATVETLPALPPEEVLFPGQEPTVPGSLNDSHLGHPDRFWGGVQYLHYWFKDAPSPQGLLLSTNAGVTSTAVGGTSYDYSSASGIGFNAGTWLNDRHTFGLQFGGFLVEQKSVFTRVSADAAGSPGLTRPFIDAVLARPAISFVSQPGTVTGSFATSAGIRMAGAEGLGIRNLVYCPNYSIDVLIGGKYVDLDEFIDITQTSRPIAGGQIFFNGAQIAPNSGVTINDRFRTRNQFWGGVVGLRGEYHFGPVFFNGTVKVGMGNNHQVVDIDGTTRIQPTTGPSVLSGGLLAVRGGNIGRNVTNRFSVVNELGAQLGINVTSHARILVGYDFLYLNNVVRPGQQIDPVINSRLVPTSANFGAVGGIASPVVTGIRDDFFVHGVRFGLELKY